MTSSKSFEDISALIMGIYYPNQMRLPGNNGKMRVREVKLDDDTTELRKFFLRNFKVPSGQNFPTNKLKLIVKKEFLAAVKAVIHKMGTMLARDPERRTAVSTCLLLN